MAQISYDEVTSRGDGDFTVGFFSLKSDGDEAIVRILCDSVSDLEILTVHPVVVGNSTFPNRNVNCIRTPREPLENCPFCSAGEKVKQRVFIKMLQYDPQTRESVAVVWDRPAGTYVPKLKSYIDNYGPLSNIMCKIIRHGSGLDTTYDIIPNINPRVYNLDAYKLDVSLFEDFKVLGRMVLDKTEDEMLAFIRTGSFPGIAEKNTTEYQEIQRPNMAPTGIPNGYQQPYNNVNNTVSAPPNPNMSAYSDGGPAPMTEESLQRPPRYY